MCSVRTDEDWKGLFCDDISSEGDDETECPFKVEDGPYDDEEGTEEEQPTKEREDHRESQHYSEMEERLASCDIEKYQCNDHEEQSPPLTPLQCDEDNAESEGEGSSGCAEQDKTNLEREEAQQKLQLRWEESMKERSEESVRTQQEMAIRQSYDALTRWAEKLSRVDGASSPPTTTTTSTSTTEVVVLKTTGKEETATAASQPANASSFSPCDTDENDVCGLEQVKEDVEEDGKSDISHHIVNSNESDNGSEKSATTAIVVYESDEEDTSKDKNLTEEEKKEKERLRTIAEMKERITGNTGKK